MRPRVDIVLPCYNPPSGWQASVNQLCEHLRSKYAAEVIVVDDGTQTEKISDSVAGITAVQTRLVTLPANHGKGYALREGVRLANAQWIIYTDIDVPFTTESINMVLDSLIREGNDVVAGYRDRSYYHKSMSGGRRRLSRAFRFFMRRVLRITLDDTQCGLKGFNSRGRDLFLRTKVNRYLFDFEFIYTALRDKRIRVKSVPVTLKDNVQFSNMRWPVLVRESLNLAGVLLRRSSRR